VEHIAVFANGKRKQIAQDAKLVKEKCSGENVRSQNAVMRKGTFIVVFVQFFPVQRFNRHSITQNMEIMGKDWLI
jgi:hypothetical protein